MDLNTLKNPEFASLYLWGGIILLILNVLWLKFTFVMIFSIILIIIGILLSPPKQKPLKVQKEEQKKKFGADDLLHFVDAT